MLKFLRDLKAASAAQAARPRSRDEHASNNGHGGDDGNGYDVTPINANGSGGAEGDTKFKVYRVHRTHTRSTARRGRIVAVSIGLLNQDHLLRYSVCEVTEPSLYDKQVPRINSLQDLRMGPGEREWKCSTCGGFLETCKGHWGHFTFKLAVFHVSYLTSILRVLQCVCHSCSRFLLSPKDPRFAKIMSIQDPLKRLAEFARVCQTIDYCGGPPPQTAENGATDGTAPKLSAQDLADGHNEGCHSAQHIYLRHKISIVCCVRKKKVVRVTKKAAGVTATKGAAKSATTGGIGKKKRKTASSHNGQPAKKRRLTASTSGLDGDDASESTVASNGRNKRRSRQGRGLMDDESCSVANADDGDDDDTRVRGLSDNDDDDDDDDLEDNDDDDDRSTALAMSDDEAEDGKSLTDSTLGPRGHDGDRDRDDDGDVDADLIVDDASENSAGGFARRGRGRGAASASSSGIDDKSAASMRFATVPGMGAAASTTSKVSLKSRCGEQLPFMPEDALNIFRRIDERDYDKVGFKAGVTRPQYMILKHFPVSPPCTRLATISSQGSKSRGETDATKHLKRILGFSNQIKAKYEIIDNKLLSVSVRKAALNDVLNSKNGLFDKLQRATAAYIDNDVHGVAPVTFHTKMPMKSMVDRLKTKEGRVRGNLNAKRVDFCARTVIGPATHSDIDQLGVPVFVCMRVTYPERVTPMNIHRLRVLVLRGPLVYPGANTIIRRDGELVDLCYARNRRRTLQVGDIVERHLQRGDVVLFNRQPSLHRMSLMAFLAYPHAGSTFLLNLACTKPFNADFDGDEMNLHVPQNEEAVAEAKTIMKVERQINDPQDKACMGVVQDAQIAAHLCTDKDVFVTREEMMQCAAQMLYWKPVRARDHESSSTPNARPLKDATLEHKNANTNDEDRKDGSSMRAEDGVHDNANVDADAHSNDNVNDANDSDDDDDDGLPPPAIRCRLDACDPALPGFSVGWVGRTASSDSYDANGWVSLWTGKQCASLTMPRSESVGVHLSLRLGERAAVLKDEAVCIDDSELLVGRLTKSVIGPTRGAVVQNTVHDFGHEVTRRYLSDVQRFFNYWISERGYGIGMSDCITDPECERGVHRIIDHSLKYLSKWDHPNAAVKEQFINAVLEEARSEAGVLVQEQRSSERNQMTEMIDSGTKGTKINPSQTKAMVGQTKLAGERVAMSYDGRSLPHFPKDCSDPRARGFVRHSFIEGLDALEAYFHAMGGREGLVDTATKTASVGYIGRKLMRCLEDVRMHYDQTVRDPYSIVTFSYGGDGVDTSWIETQYYPCLAWTLDDLHKCYDGRRRDWSWCFAPVDDPNWRQSRQRLLEAAMKREFDDLVEDVLMIRLLKTRGSAQLKDMDTEVKAPVHFMRLLRNARAGMLRRRHQNQHDTANPGLGLNRVNPGYVLVEVQKLIAWCGKQMRCESALCQFLALLRVNLCAVNVVVYNELDQVAFDWVVQQVRKRLLDALVHAGEMVGPVAGQSISEPTQQMTLNSVDWTENIIIRRHYHCNGHSTQDIIVTPIGKFIDDMVLEMPTGSQLRKHPNDTLELDITRCTSSASNIGLGRVDTLSVTADGDICWRRVEGVTRHPPLRDGKRDKLLRVRTRGNLSVTATRAESFLLRRENVLVRVKGAELKVGDRLPVSMTLPISSAEAITTLDLSRFLPKDKWTYGSDVHRVQRLITEFAEQGAGALDKWYEEQNGKLFTLPFKRRVHCVMVSVAVRDGYVYPKMRRDKTTTQIIPEHLPLTYDFGFFVGAYLSRGFCFAEASKVDNATRGRHTICISNQNAPCIDIIERFVKTLNVRVSVAQNKATESDNRNCCDIRIVSSALRALMGAMCGCIASDKKVPDWCLIAPDDFLRGVCHAYFSAYGYGCVSDTGCIEAQSVSEELADGMIRVLKRLGIFSVKHVKSTAYLPNQGHGVGGEQRDATSFYISIMGRNAKLYADTIGAVIEAETKRMREITGINECMQSVGQMDIIPGNDTLHVQGDIHRDELRVLIAKIPADAKHKAERDVLQKAADSDVYYDQIVSIVEVESSHEHVYDLTVEDTRTFVLANGISLYDTFHTAGVGGKNMTFGISQLDEYIRVSHKPRASSLEVFLMPDRQTKAAAHDIVKQIKPLSIGKFVSQHDIFFDPDPLDTVIVEDRPLVRRYAALTDAKEVRNLSSFVLRFVIDRNKCLSYGKTINHVFWAMKAVLPDAHHWIKSAVNSKTWILRLRLKTNSSDFRKYEKRKVTKKAAGTFFSSAAATAAAAAAAAASAASGKDGTAGASGGKLTLTETQTVKHVRTVLINTHLHGILGIISATIRTQKCTDFDSKTLAVSTRDEFVIDTRGTNMLAVMNLPGVDHTRVMSSNVVEVEELLGIEAASTVLLQNIQRLFANNGAYVNYHHVHTLVKAMCKTGTLVGLNRNGFHQDRRLGFLKRCSFEKIVRVLTDAAQLGELDTLEGVTSNIIIGSEPPIGTATTTVYYRSNPQLLAQHRDVVEQNQIEVAHRLMEPVQPVDLMRLVPSVATQSLARRATSAQTASHSDLCVSSKGAVAGASFGFGSETDRYEQAISEKNRKFVIPNYSLLLPSHQPSSSQQQAPANQTAGGSSATAAGTQRAWFGATSAAGAGAGATMSGTSKSASAAAGPATMTASRWPPGSATGSSWPVQNAKAVAAAAMAAAKHTYIFVYPTLYQPEYTRHAHSHAHAPALTVVTQGGKAANANNRRRFEMDTTWKSALEVQKRSLTVAANSIASTTTAALPLAAGPYTFCPLKMQAATAIRLVVAATPRKVVASQGHKGASGKLKIVNNKKRKRDDESQPSGRATKQAKTGEIRPMAVETLLRLMSQ